jgi:drug/metabolite transporter (DMT)-like permease
MATLDSTEAVPAERDDQLALLAALVTVGLWASGFIGIRSAGHVFSPGALALGRLLVATVALGILAVVRREPLPSRRALPGIAVCGVFWFGLYNVVLNEGERQVDAGTAAMLVNVGPILIALLAGLLLHEGFPRGLLAGCAIALSGAVIIGAATSKQGIVPSWGAVLCVVAALAYAVGAVAQKPLLAYTSPLQVTTFACALGAFACVPFAPALARELPHARASAVGWMIYLAIGPMAVGFMTWAYALKRTTAGRMGSTTYLVTPMAILLGWLVLGETPPALAFAGGVLCLVGVAVARRRAPGSARRP